VESSATAVGGASTLGEEAGSERFGARPTCDGVEADELSNVVDDVHERVIEACCGGLVRRAGMASIVGGCR
jgi:hypothetical protein